MIYFSDFSVPSGPAGDVTMAVQDFDTGTSTGAQSFTSATITGVTPKAALVIGALHDPTNDPGETAGATLSVGVIDATTDYRLRASSRDNLASTDVVGAFGAGGLHILSNANSSIKVADGALASGGVSLDFTTNSSPSLRHFFIAFAGADVAALFGTKGLGTGTSAQDIATVGFEPDVVILVGGTRGNETASALFDLTLGIAVNDGSATQRGVLWAEADNIADGRPFQTLRTDAAGGQASESTGALSYKVTVSDFDASGFSVTCSASAGSDMIGWLALNFGGRQFKLVDFDTPTATGSHTITGAGFTPQFALAILTNLETVNDHPGATSDNQSGLSICAIGSDEQWSASWRINAAEATTDTASQVANVALMGASDTDCDAIKATFTAWTSDGVTLNFSAVQANAKKGFILFVE